MKTLYEASVEGNLIKAIDECLVPEGSYFMDGEWWWRNDIVDELELLAPEIKRNAILAAIDAAGYAVVPKPE